jgi:hypothetical protein
MALKWVGDFLSVEGFYLAWFGLHDSPFLLNSELRDKGETVADTMIPVSELVTINGRQSTRRVLG